MKVSRFGLWSDFDYVNQLSNNDSHCGNVLALLTLKIGTASLAFRLAGSLVSYILRADGNEESLVGEYYVHIIITGELRNGEYKQSYHKAVGVSRPDFKTSTLV